MASPDAGLLRWAVRVAAPGGRGRRGPRPARRRRALAAAAGPGRCRPRGRAPGGRGPGPAGHRGGRPRAGRRPRHPGPAAARRRPGSAPAGRARRGRRGGQHDPGRAAAGPAAGPRPHRRRPGRGPPGPTPALPRRDRPIATVDFAALRRRPPPRPLLLEAEARLAALPPSRAPEGFIHGDLWQGNALWDGETLAALVDWDCAGAGPAGVDLGSLRCDAAVCFGAGAADDVLAGWEEAAGRPAAEVTCWDVVAALSTPPDMGWFPGAIAGQGRPDLGRELLLARRDAFLRDALDRLGGG